MTEAIAVIIADLARMIDWSHIFGLAVNHDKTQFSIIGSIRRISRLDWSTLLSVYFDGTFFLIKLLRT